MYYITNGKELMLLNCGVLEKTFESPLDCKEIKPDNPKGNQPWIFLEGLMLKLKLQLLWPPDVNSQLFGKDPDTWKDWRQEKETTADKMVGWHHWLNGVSFRRWWRTGKPGMLQSTGLQRVGSAWATEQQQHIRWVSDAVQPSHPLWSKWTTTICTLSQWCHPTISSFVVPFSSCPQYFPASGFFPTSQFSTSGGQRFGVSASASILPVNIQDWFPLGLAGWISLQSKGL